MDNRTTSVATSPVPHVRIYVARPVIPVDMRGAMGPRDAQQPLIRLDHDHTRLSPPDTPHPRVRTIGPAHDQGCLVDALSRRAAIPMPCPITTDCALEALVVLAEAPKASFTDATSVAPRNRDVVPGVTAIAIGPPDPQRTLPRRHDHFVDPRPTFRRTGDRRCLPATAPLPLPSKPRPSPAVLPPCVPVRLDPSAHASPQPPADPCDPRCAPTSRSRAVLLHS